MKLLQINELIQKKINKTSKIRSVTALNSKQLNNVLDFIFKKTGEIENLNLNSNEIEKELLEQLKEIEEISNADQANLVCLEQQKKIIEKKITHLENIMTNNEINLISEADRDISLRKRVRYEILQQATGIYLDNSPSSTIRGFHCTKNPSLPIKTFELSLKDSSENNNTEQMWEFLKENSSNVKKWEDLFNNS